MDTTWVEDEELVIQSRMASTCGSIHPSGCGM